MNNIIEVKEHGTAYFINKHGRLSSYPMLANGGFDKGAEMEIVQSPVSFKVRHINILKELGVKKELIAGILKYIHYE